MSPEEKELVERVAGGFLDQGLSLEELVAAGKEGLEKARPQFDPTRGYKFTTYATWWIRRAICVAITKADRAIPEASEQLIEENLRERTTQALQTLTPREEQILRLRFGIGEKTDDEAKRTLEEVGKDFEATRARIRAIERRALEKLRMHGELKEEPKEKKDDDDDRI